MTTRALRSRPLAGATVSLCALSLAVFSAGCDRATTPPQPIASESESSAATNSNTRSYSVRGQVVLVPVPANPATELQIHHEHIPDFVGWDGKLHINSDGVPGMKSMTMPFPVEDPSVLAGVGPGDRVKFTLNVDTENRRFWVSEMTKLSDDAPLDYTDKAPPVEHGGPDAPAIDGP